MSGRANAQGDSLIFTRPADDNIWNLDRSAPGRIYQGGPKAGDFADAAGIGTLDRLWSEPLGEVRWPAPVLAAPTVISIPERGSDVWQLAPGKDYVLRFVTGRRYGPLRIYGGRNVVLIGGEQIIDNTTSADYRDRRLFEFRDQTGTVHVEGYFGHGPGATEGFNLWTPDAIFQLQNSRVKIKRINSEAEPQHPDVIQTWSGPNELRVYNFTALTDYQGFLLAKDVGGVYPGRVILDRVNFRCLPNPAWDGKCWPVNHLWLLSKLTEVRLGDVWAETGWWNGTLHRGLKDSLGYRDPSVRAPLWAWQEFKADGSAYGPEVVGQAGDFRRLAP